MYERAFAVNAFYDFFMRMAYGYKWCQVVAITVYDISLATHHYIVGVLLQKVKLYLQAAGQVYIIRVHAGNDVCISH